MKRTCIVLTALALLVTFSVTGTAEEYPVVPGTEIVLGTTPVEQDQVEPRPVFTKDPVWKGLERLSKEERLNSLIALDLPKDASQAALQMASRIENAWNSANFEEALALFRPLANLTNIEEVAISNSWRTPIPTDDLSSWGTDVRIGNRDSILVTSFDIHRASGNLFAILLYQSGSTYYWSVNFSTNGGATWTETYEWWASYEIRMVSASVLTDYCYVGYIGTSYQEDARLRRFHASNGNVAAFPNGAEWISAFGTLSPMEEIMLVSNQDFYDNRLYYLSLLETGEVGYFWDDPACTSWLEIPTGIGDADRGLDATCNEGYADYFLCLSYINFGDTLKIYGKSSTWDRLSTYATNSASTDFTDIGAYRDTMTCAFDYYNGTNLQCRYLVSYNGGPTWYWGNVGDDPSTTAESPGLAARAGGGVGIVYRFYTSPRQGRYVWRPYGGEWTTPETYNDHELYYNKPSIEQLGGGQFGVVYLTWNSPQVRAAYFDRQSLLPDVSIELVPDHSPVVVPRGGSFGFTGIVTNNTNLVQRVDIWLMAYVPGIGMYGPLKQYNNIPFNAYQSRSAHLNQKIPNAAPISDRYIYYGYVGDYPSTVIDSSYFRFEVTAKELARAGADDWILTGSFLEGSAADLPTEFALLGNYPNPFNASTVIEYQLPVSSNVTLEVYNVLGEKVATLLDGEQQAGYMSVTWDASEVSSGVYFYKLAAGDFTETKRMMLVK